MDRTNRTIGIVGLGLIGGSIAIDLKRKGFASQIVGVEADKVHAETALRIGLASEVLSLEECVRKSDIIVVSIPVSAAVQLLPRILDLIAQSDDPGSKIVMDVCSVKEKVTQSVHYHEMRRRYVATHPMAGTEYSGPWAAMPGLFDGRACIICDAEESDPKAVRQIEELYEVLNMRVTHMRSSNHDVHTAYVSHLSHVTSFALALTVLDKEKDEKHIFDLASGGFSSTVRLAKSGPDMWAPIFMQNRDNLLRGIDTYIEKMQAFREAIADYDEEQTRELIEGANKIRRIIR